MSDETKPAAPAPRTMAEMRERIREATSGLDTGDLERYKDRAAAADERLSWAPVIGNGTAIVALAGIVGSALSPDTALTALTAPLAVFCVGLALGLAAIYLKSTVMDGLGSFPRLMQPSRTELLRLLDEVELLVGRMTPENAGATKAATDALAAKVPELVGPTSKVGRKLRNYKLRAQLATVLSAAATAAVAIGFSVLLIGHAAGALRLERTTQVNSAPPVAQRKR